MDDNSWPAVSEAYREIGRVANNWALLEESVEEILWFLVEGNLEKGRAVTTYINAASQIDIIRLLVREKRSEEEVTNNLNPILVVLKELRLQRNLAVHSRWKSVTGTSINPTVKAITYRPRRTLEGLEKELSTADIAATADTIKHAHLELLTYFSRTFGFAPSIDIT